MQSSVTSDVRRTVQENGLRVLVKENRASAVAAVVAHVHVGYFNEPDRWSGISHVIEHMLFKGTAKRPGKEQIAEEVRALGGTLNAGTYYEDTSYYIVVPSERLEAAIEIQTDMLRRSRIDSEELAKELEVIIQESKQKRDSPGALLLETMYARAYDRHRIRRWRIGEDETLRALRSEDLRAFLEETYRPENMVISVVGAVDPGTALSTVERYWGDLPRGTLRREASPEEPPRQGFRYERMRGDIQQRLLVAGFPAPPQLAPEAASLMVLDAVLADGRSSRLYRSLKEDRRLVNSVWADYEGFERMGVFTLGAEVTAEDPLSAEEELFRQVAMVAEEGAAEEDLERVKTRIESRRLYAQEEVLGIARSLSRYESLGDYRLLDAVRARMQAVTSEDVSRAAAQFLDPERATLVEYLPTSVDAPDRPAEAVSRALSATLLPTRSAAGRLWQGAGEPVQTALPSGATLVFRPRKDLPLVALYVLFRGGRPGETVRNAGITNLLLKSSLKGTESFSAVEIASRVEGLGSGIGTSLGPDYFGFSLKILEGRVSQGVEVLREVITRPTFPADEVEKEKQAIYAEIRRQQDSMSGRAVDLFQRAMFGDQPYGLPTAGIREAVEAITPDTLREWHLRWVRGGGAVIAVAGDLSLEQASELAAGLTPPGAAGPPLDTGPVLMPSREEAEEVERQQTAAVLGFPGAPIGAPDRHALDLLVEITSGLAGRFFQAVRGENGLAYAVSSFHRSRRSAGIFATYTATSPDRETAAREILLAECRRLAEEPVAPKELADAKAAVRGEQVIHTQTFSAQAGELAMHAVYGLPLDESERYLARMESLTAEELQEAAGRHLRPEQSWLGVVRGRVSRES